MMHLARLRAAGIHLAASAGAAAIAAALVFGVWYPGDYARMAGGSGLFWLVVAVDIVMGPLLTAVVFDVRKPRRELIRDLAVIALLQLGALAYGVQIMWQARPVHLVFEVDRFRVVTAADIDTTLLPKAAPDFRRLPITGPTLIAARRSTSGDELLEGVASALGGVEISMQPARWVPYDASMRTEALTRATPLDARLAAWPVDRRDRLTARAEQLAAAAGISLAQVRLLPLQSRFVNWSAVLDPDGDLIGFLDVDGF
jgi:hypothetical protein